MKKTKITALLCALAMSAALFSPVTASAEKAGWQEIDGKRYYYSADGKMATSSVNIGGIRWRFDSNGVCLGKYSGMVMNKSTGAKYYYKNGKKQKGWVTRKGKTYYFSEDTGRMLTGYFVCDGYVYFLGSDGVWDGSKITYAEYKEAQKKLRPETVGEQLEKIDLSSVKYIEVWLTSKSKRVKLTGSQMKKFLSALEGNSDVKLEYNIDASDDEISLSESYSGKDDILARFMTDEKHSAAGFYFSKDKSGNGYIYSLTSFFSAKLNDSSAYDLLKKAYK